MVDLVRRCLGEAGGNCVCASCIFAQSDLRDLPTVFHTGALDQSEGRVLRNVGLFFAGRVLAGGAGWESDDGAVVVSVSVGPLSQAAGVVRSGGCNVGGGASLAMSKDA